MKIEVKPQRLTAGRSEAVNCWEAEALPVAEEARIRRRINCAFRAFDRKTESTSLKLKGRWKKAKKKKQEKSQSDYLFLLLST